MDQPSKPGASAEDGLSLPDALEIAVRAHRSGDVAVAETLYTRILAVAPDYADALHFLGILHHQTRRSLEAVRLIRQAIAHDPENPAMHNNLGNVFVELGRPDLAVKAFEMAIVLEPRYVDARNNLGVCLRLLGQPAEAETVYREAVALDPRHRESWDNLGRLLVSRGAHAEGIACHETALTLEPSNAQTRRHLVEAYIHNDESERALAILRRWLREEPESATARHLVAALSGEGVPERASDAYVTTLFDGFADSFDLKLAQLDYRAPAHVAAAVTRAYPTAGADLAILDAGCGTGLCGPALRPHAETLVGVDLSGKMLDKAQRRGLYDRLDRAELTAYLSARAEAYDLVVSADTLCYFGALDAVAASVRGALKPGGRFVFSIEALAEARDYRLHTHGRYSHAQTYVERVLGEAGFLPESFDRETLRLERGLPVEGFVVTARRL